MTVYRAGELDMSNMWSILGMPAPLVLAQSAVGLTGPLGNWKRTLTYADTSWAFQKLVAGAGAYYISHASRYMLVVEE